MAARTHTWLAAVVLAVTIASCSSNDATNPIGPPASLQVVSGDLQHAPAGSELTEALTVKVLDAQGHPVPGQTVNFVVVSGGGSVFAGAATTNAQGIARERWTIGTAAADTQRVEVRAVDAETGEALVFAVFRAIADPGPVAGLLAVGGGQEGTVGTALPQQMGVRVVDEFGNPISGVDVTFAASAGTLAATEATTNADGVAIAGSWTLGTVAGYQAVTATVTGHSPLEIGASAVAGPATQLVFLAPPPASATSGVPLPPTTLTRADQYGNLVSVVLSVRAFLEGSGTLQGLTQESNSFGTVALNLTIVGTTGTRRLRFEHNTQFGGLPQLPPIFADISLTKPPTLTGTQVVSGLAHGCAIATSGNTYCWGKNDRGQLGIGTITPDPTDKPTTPVGGGLQFVSVQSGYMHSCGLTSAGTMYCWGSNEFGQLGDGTTTHRGTPVVVSGGLTFATLVMGHQMTCGITTVDEAWCWGHNIYGQVGDQTRTNRSTPQPVAGGHKFRLLAAMEDVCGLTPGDTLFCWGRRTGPSDGYGVPPGPTPVGSSPYVFPFEKLIAGYQSTCGIKSAGEVWCWGKIPSTGFLNQPARVHVNSTFETFSVGFTSECGILTSGVAVCGGNESVIQGGYTFTKLQDSWSRVCGITTTNDVMCWGTRYVGDGSFLDRNGPVFVLTP